jgi:hypothetical protein
MKQLSLIIVAGSLAIAAQAQLIDDFNSAGLGEYTSTRLLDNAVSEGNVSLADASGSLGASYGGTLAGAEQSVLLRNDFSLSVGYRLMVDVSFGTKASEMDFGIAVGSTASPTAASGADTDTRDTFNWAAIYVRPSQNTVRATSFINGTGATGTGILAADETTVGQLFIERTSLTGFTLGYYDTSAVRHDSRTATFTVNDVGTAIGFYADLRAVGGSLGALDNLRIEAVPEPGSLSLLALGGVGVWLVRRRNSAH